jgi:hypothetical protein
MVTILKLVVHVMTKCQNYRKIKINLNLCDGDYGDDDNNNANNHNSG